MSLRGISLKLCVSKSSVSLWCADIVLTQKQIEHLSKEAVHKGLKGRLVGAYMNRQKKINSVNKALFEAEKTLGKLNHRDLLLLAAGLFWGEGSKTDSRFIFINSDPAMIKLVKDFLVKNMGVQQGEIRATVQINAIHKARIEKVMQFWSKHLNLPLSQFANPYYVYSVPKKVYENHQTYTGILRLRVLRSSGLQYKMLGLIAVLKKEYMPV